MSAAVLGLSIVCRFPPGLAAERLPASSTAETALDPEENEPAVYFKTEADFYLGYRWLTYDDSLKAAEYLYPHSSVSFGLNLLSAPLPNRYHANVEFISKHDYFADAGFAYKDLILFRDILVGVHHNLDYLDYQFAGEPPGLIYTERNPADDYYLDYISNLLSLRLKAPDFPFHTFLKHHYVEREGTVQQRFLRGYFGELDMVSEARDIDWQSNALTLGANSHLGPFEIEYAYDQSDFDPGPNSILYDSYPEFNGTISRPADIYPHNVNAETESWANTIKLHSSYTGGIVAAATLSNLVQENNFSQAESTTWKGAFDLSWIPAPPVGFFFKYRHRDVDMTHNDTFSLNGVNSTINYPVREGVSYNKDVLSISTRYKPLQILSLFGKYEYSHLKRDNVESWFLLPWETDIHSIDLWAHAKPLDQLTLKVIYEYKNYDQPAYNTTPDKSNKLKLTTNYTPSPSINIYLEYILAKAERDALHYTSNDLLVPPETGSRNSRNDQFLASLTTAITPKLSLTLSWFYQNWDIDQDLAYSKWPMDNGDDLSFIDAAVPYNDQANSFSLSLLFFPRQDFSVAFDLTYTIAEGTTGYSDVVGGAQYSISSFTELELAETNISLDLAKKLPNDWEIGFNSDLNIFNDKTADLLDGDVFTTTFFLKRYF